MRVSARVVGQSWPRQACCDARHCSVSAVVLCYKCVVHEYWGYAGACCVRRWLVLCGGGACIPGLGERVLQVGVHACAAAQQFGVHAP
jgi:hypothetical protein